MESDTPKSLPPGMGAKMRRPEFIPKNMKYLIMFSIGFVGISMSTMLHKMAESDRLKSVNMPYCIQFAIDLMRKDGIVELIGQPYSFRPSAITRFPTRWPAESLKVTLPVVGMKDSGELSVYAHRKGQTDNYLLTKVDISFKSLPNRRALLWEKEEGSEGMQLNPSLIRSK